MGNYREGAKERARNLRSSQTPAERRLWSILRNRQFHGLKFVRQVPVGPYFADFACRERDLIIEIDGSQHYESAYDERRTAVLADHGYKVLRFWNNEVLNNLDGVYRAIEELLAKAPSPGLRFTQADLSPEGRGGPGASPELSSGLSGAVATDTSPFGGEVDAKRRVRGPRAAAGDMH